MYRLKGTSGPLVNQSFRLAERLLIGRADDCDVRVDSEDVEAHHLEVLMEDGAVLMRHLGTARGARVNGHDVDQAKLAGGDEIQLGNVRLMLQAPGLRPDRVLDEVAVAPRARRWPLVVAFAAVVAAAVAWQLGYLDRWLALLGS